MSALHEKAWSARRRAAWRRLPALECGCGAVTLSKGEWERLPAEAKRQALRRARECPTCRHDHERRMA